MAALKSKIGITWESFQPVQIHLRPLIGWERIVVNTTPSIDGSCKRCENKHKEGRTKSLGSITLTPSII